MSKRGVVDTHTYRGSGNGKKLRTLFTAKTKRLPFYLLAALICASATFSSWPLPTASAQSASMTFSEIATHPQAAAQSTAKGKTIHKLEFLNNKLYAGYGDYDSNTGPITINPLDLDTDTFLGSQLSIPTEEINNLRPIDGKLYAPTIDPTCANSCAAGYGVGEPWETVRPINAIHIFDIGSLDGDDLWMVGAAGASVATAWRSTDGGDTWQVVQTDFVGSDGYDRYYWIASMNGKIYMQAAGISPQPPVRIFDGTSWTNGTTSVVAPVDTTVTVFKDHIISRQSGLSAFDGTTVAKVASFIGSARDYYVSGDYLYVLRTDNTVVRTSDLKGWQELGTAPSGSSSIAVEDDTLYIGTSTSKIYRSEGAILEPPVASIDSPLDGSTVDGVINVTADVTGSTPVNRVVFTLNGSMNPWTVNEAPYTVSTNTETWANGTYTLSARAYYDNTSFSTTDTITFTVQNSQSSSGNATTEFPNAPITDFPQTNGTVRTILSAPDGSTYIGGDFTAVDIDVTPAYSTPFGVPISTSTGAPAYTAVNPNGTVNASISDGDGGWYIGGSFTEVGGVTRNRLAHILPNGSLDPDFDPNVSGSSVGSLALAGDGSTLYAGGTFTTVNGSTARNNLAAFDTSTGVATSFNPNTNTGVSTLALSPDGQTLYAGGGFTTVNGSTTRNRLAAFSTSDSTVTSFNPDVNSNISILALAPNGSTLYAGGTFNTVNGSTLRSRLAAFDTSTGIATSFDPSPNQTVSTLAITSNGSTLYAGGTFNTVNGSTLRSRLAAFDTSTGIATSFDPNINPDRSFGRIVLTSDDQTLYAGGREFTTVNGNVSRNRLAAFDTSTGIATSFDPNIRGGEVWALALSPDNQTLYAGGGLTGIGGKVSGGVPRNRLARILPDGTVDPNFDPNMSSGVFDLALTNDGEILYAGGTFTTVNGNVTRNRVAAFNTSTGIATSFNPNVNGTVNTLTLTSDNTILYAGGQFNGANSVNGNVTRNRVAAFNTSTGIATSFNPNVAGSSSGLAVNDLILTSNDQTLYVGGGFSLVNGSTARNNLAAFNTSDSIATSFNPNLNNPVVDLALTNNGEILYAGGQFTAVNGSTARNFLSAFDTSTSIATSFNPNLSSSVLTIALTNNGETLYAGGAFTTVNGSTARNSLAAFNTSTATATSFNPNVNGNQLIALALTGDDSTLYAGGAFTTVNGSTARNNLAAFYNPDLDGDGVPNTEEQDGPNGGDANNDEVPDYQQAHIATLIDPKTGQYAVLAVSEECSINSVSLVAESSNQAADESYNYPVGLMDFTLNCGIPGFTADVAQYYYGVTGDFIVRKYNPNTDTYSTISGASVADQTIGGQAVKVATYQVTDGGELDTDGVADAVITDPAGLAVAAGFGGAVGTLVNNLTGDLANTGFNLLLALFMSGLLMAGGILGLRRRKTRTSHLF